MTSVSTDQLLAQIAANGGGGGGPAEWGAIEGDIALQADLQAALDDKADAADLDEKLDTPSGTPSATTYARGDGQWATPPNTTYTVITEAEATTGTATTARVVSAQSLARDVNNRISARIDGLTIDRITQAAYDALPSKDANTLYLIVPE